MVLQLYGSGEDVAASTGLRSLFSGTNSYDSQLSAIMSQSSDRLRPSSRVYVFARHTDPDAEVEFRVEATSFTLLAPGMASQVVLKPIDRQQGVQPVPWPAGFEEQELPFSVGLCADVDFSKPWLYDGTLEQLGFASDSLNVTDRTAALLGSGSREQLNFTEIKAFAD